MLHWSAQCFIGLQCSRLTGAFIGQWSGKTFEEDLRTAADLDTVIAAHAAYLENMLVGALLGDEPVAAERQADHQAAPAPESVRPLFVKLGQIFDTVLRFHDAQRMLHDQINAEIAARAVQAYQTEHEDRWGVRESEPAMESGHGSTQRAASSVMNVIRDYDVVRPLRPTSAPRTASRTLWRLIPSSWAPIMALIMAPIMHSSWALAAQIFRDFYSELRLHDRLAFLYFRLDFNNYYSKDT